ncbi:Gag-Pol polyprotein [Thelohanellus kitauei]|uniref:Gag-Pol polyprotein n=1 Tax=Thelohanellus kitauei TaxID=669202 RepID=A0A0C2IB22_THEKT|nr:Gag-Pol polyprotein [Thelohanellus kitauei]KII62560.1 Gag-Pol polyprotein [Thelohanellus kitauei]
MVEVIPIPDQSAATASRALINCVVSRFGIPDQIHSDQRRQFESELFKETCKVLGITKSRTTPYHPEANGNVERENRTIKEMLRHHVNEYQDNWDKYLNIVLFCIRSSKHASTRFSPAEMTLGRKLKYPANLEFSAINPHPADNFLITEEI